MNSNLKHIVSYSSSRDRKDRSFQEQLIQLGAKNELLSSGLAEADSQFKRVIKKIRVKASGSNWFNFNSKTGVFNGHKLFLGSRNGIYYLTSSSRTYVTRFFE